MADADILFDMPCEPHIHAPKTSLIIGGTNQSKALAHTYQDISITTRLGMAKFPVYLAKCVSQNKTYAMKVFPTASQDDQIYPYFQNEVRFASFAHPNIIKTVHVEHKKEFTNKKGSQTVAYTLMEYAPYGDFFNLVSDYGKNFDDEKLVRTYFRQLIEGLEYIHNRGAAHLDLKLDNLLLGENYILKIADFDLSAFVGDSKTLAKGTKSYRAPEIIETGYTASTYADIYSAGVILFVLKTGGVLPHCEEANFKGVNLFDLLNQNNLKFWEKHCEIQQQDSCFFSGDFKELFNSMMKVRPSERATIQQVKKSAWYNGEIYTRDELKKLVKSILD